MVFPGFFPLGIPKVRRCDNLVHVVVFPGFFHFDSKSCRYRKMLQNEYLLAKIGADTAENEPSPMV